ncbi:hypothetical protein BDV95DRAFT_609816 [Massariosphaeria phaeospora]|uniref:Uncharacterized protein n=1 Tax=Massariosphaeria phaeospora TaxID=100035 RepID=A0A7C8I1H6_9PLEO|nr:hypothetical protein BDV95DRAFT_609816 [Massariosphaeria phaeospora]
MTTDPPRTASPPSSKKGHTERHRSGWPTWTLNRSRYRTVSRATHEDLVALAKAFTIVNRVILEEAQRDCQLESWTRQRPNPYFRVYDLTTLSKVDENGLEATERGVAVTRFDEPTESTSLTHFLYDNAYLTVWKTAIHSMLDSQGNHFGLKWQLAKQHALDILEQRDVAARIYVDIEEELRASGQEWNKICDNIIIKIQTLERFIVVYDAQPLPSPTHQDPRPEPTYDLEPIKYMRRPAKVASAFPQTQDSHYSTTLTAIVFLTTLIAIIPLGFAWSISPSDRGTVDDTDFYLLIQNSIMTFLGIGIGICPSFRRLGSQGLWWSQILGLLGAFFAIATVPVYLNAPVI